MSTPHRQALVSAVGHYGIVAGMVATAAFLWGEHPKITRPALLGMISFLPLGVAIKYYVSERAEFERRERLEQDRKNNH